MTNNSGLVIESKALGAEQYAFDWRPRRLRKDGDTVLAATTAAGARYGASNCGW